ncbi:hypothetical protein GGR57DRAFT_357555 [Xylariaceae sp. FL1272]|nr:hypothetical protein GGR57DRAFT_357555 [Xylariaceae sp. FL1272]
MSILCCCRVDHAEEDERHPEPTELPTQSPAAGVSETLPKSDTDVFSSLGGSHGASRLVTPTYQNIVDLETVDVDDSDDEAQVGNPNPLVNGAFGSMKMKLFRGISRRVMNNSSRPQTLGASDEEIARRAELKRLMHKRIQDELKREEVDEDSASVSLENYPTEHHRESELPRGGPRDTIEFDVADEIERPAEPAALEETRKSLSRKSDKLGSTSRCPDSPTHKCNVSLDQKHLAFHSSTSPQRSLHHLSETSGRCSPSIASWRLSYSASQISDYLALAEESLESSCVQSLESDRPVSHDGGGNTSYSSRNQASTPSPTTADETINTDSLVNVQQSRAIASSRQDQNPSLYLEEPSEDQGSALNIWLRTQELRSNSIISSHSNSKILLGGADQIAQNPGSTIAEPRSAAPIGTESLALQQVMAQMEDVFRRHDDPTRDPSSRYTSSRCTTSPKSQRTTPRGSHLSLPGVKEHPERFQPLISSTEPVRPCHVKSSEKTDTSSYKTALNNISSSECTGVDHEETHLPTEGTGSVPVSHTTSFEQREEELRSVEKRFGSAPLRGHPLVPIHSRFHEEFDDYKNAGSVSSSFLSKLHLAFSKKSTISASPGGLERKSFIQFENSENVTNMLRSAFTPAPNSGSPSKVIRPVSSESIRNEEGLDGLWQRALVRDAERLSGRLKAKLSKTTVRSDMTGSNATTRNASLIMNYGTRENLRPTTIKDDDVSPIELSSGHCSIQVEEEGTTPRITIDDPVDIHACVLQEWVEQLQEEDVRRRERITTPTPRPRRLRTPPASWAKWPSETRAARTGSAGEKDLVTARDFAEFSSPSPRKGKTERKLTGKKSLPSSRALSDQIGRVLKSRWDKIIMHKNSAERTADQAPPSPEIRSSRGQLEYPELELLPTGTSAFKEVQALERQIDNIKRRSFSLAPSSRFSTEYHSSFIDAMNTSLPLTPNTQGGFPNTPQSHTSHINWLQTQSLEGDNTSVIQSQSAKMQRALSTGNIHTKSPSRPPSASVEVRDNHTYLSPGWNADIRRPQSAEGTQRTVLFRSSSLGGSSRVAGM